MHGLHLKDSNRTLFDMARSSLIKANLQLLSGRKPSVPLTRLETVETVCRTKFHVVTFSVPELLLADGF
jgi:hypothetical protein